MKEDNLKSLFEGLKDDFDIENPDLGHQQRFLAKIQGQDQRLVNDTSIPFRRNLWKPFIGIAASIALLVSVFIVTQQNPRVMDLASVSPEMSETQNFFTVAIAEQLNKLEREQSPETETLIKDAMAQMHLLETEYEALKLDLTESGDDNRVIYAMISNFQNRIALLQSVLENIEIVKQLKQDTNENSITI
jgi:uncharacterized protein YeeX (DUF496 family)